ncbi:MAG TPA: nucleotidyltransferase domain-containing protein [Patescibacteria group bacterium]
MITDTKKNIIAFISTKGEARVHDLVKEFGISKVAVHKQLNNLIKEGKIKKMGMPPKVFYILDEKPDLGQVKNTINENLGFLKSEFKVKEIGVFGSVVRGDNNSGSDIDILVSFSQTPGFFKFIQLEDYLFKILGKKVDLVTKDALKNAIKDDVLKETIYV